MICVIVDISVPPDDLAQLADDVDKVYLAITEGQPRARDCDATLVQRGDRVVALDHYDPTDGLGAYTAFEVVRRSDTHALVRCTARTG